MFMGVLAGQNSREQRAHDRDPNFDQQERLDPQCLAVTDESDQGGDPPGKTRRSHKKFRRRISLSCAITRRIEPLTR